MRIRLLTTMAYPGGRHVKGDELELPDGEALEMIDSKHAEAVEPPAEKHTAG